MKEHVCPHMPPYANCRRPTAEDFTDTNGDSFPEAVEHYASIGGCKGKDGKTCPYGRMAENKYLPHTRFPNFKFGKSTWNNALATRSPYDVIRAARTQLNSRWHKFWFAAHRLRAHVSGALPASQEQQISEALRTHSRKLDCFKRAARETCRRLVAYAPSFCWQKK